MLYSFKKNYAIFGIIALLLFAKGGFAQNTYMNVNLDTVKSSLIDMGKMWTFEFAPKDYLKKTYNFDATDEWLEKARLSSLKFATWCSASFVSADGLIMTNHHCAREVAFKVQNKNEDFQKKGFYAKTQAMERKVPELFVEEMIFYKDVTADVKAAIDTAKSNSQKVAAKKAIIEKLESEFKGKNGIDRAQVVTLFNGGKFSLYGFKKYTDIRLVFVPEIQLGFYGGDWDNFTYPRYDGDFSFFRAYENGKPAKIKNFFKWSGKGANEGELIFTIGNPGRTNRLKTVAQLEFFKNFAYPARLEMLTSRANSIREYMAKNPNASGELLEDLFSISNSQKVYDNSIKYLYDPIVMKKKQDFETNFRNSFNAKNLANKYGIVWDSISSIKNSQKAFYNEYIARSFVMEKRSSLCDYFDLALAVSKEVNAVSDDSLKASVDSIVAKVFNKTRKESHYNALQNIYLANAINLLNKYMGNSEEFKTLLNGKSGADAVDYITKTAQITTPAKLKALLLSGKKSLMNDAIYVFVTEVSKKYKSLEAQYSKLSRREDIYLTQLGQALFEVFGTDISPDATFTLRLSDGVIKGYEYNGTIAPPKTTFYGFYDRFHSHKGKSDWEIPESWKKNEKSVNLSTPFDFASTNDIIGGNSGSPIINTKHEIVGIAFDGNLESNAGDFIYDNIKNRCIGVDSQGIFEALSKVYKADRITKELKKGGL